MYIEKFRILENPRALDDVCREMAEIVRGENIEMVLGAAIGGILIAGGVGKHLGVKHIFSERVNGQMVLRRGFAIEKDHRVVIVEDIITTGEILSILNENQIDFEVIPEYDLVHYFDKITKLFIGTQALTNDNYLICDPGTSNIVSECHIHEIPIYLFLKTLKFSHYPAADQNIRKNSYQDEHNGIEYDYSIHSNDIINLKLISNIITEQGELPLDQIPSVREQILFEN